MSTLTVAIEHVMTSLTNADVPALVGGRVFQGAAPIGAKHPLILVQTYGDTADLLAVGKPTAGSVVEILVRVVAPSPSLTTLESIHDAVTDALHGSSGSNSRGSVAACTRISESETTDATETGVIRYLGGRFRLVVNPQLM